MMTESPVWVDMGTMPGWRARRSVKLRPLSATSVIVFAATTSPIWVLAVSTWTSTSVAVSVTVSSCVCCAT